MRSYHISLLILALASSGCLKKKNTSGARPFVWDTTQEWNAAFEEEFSKFVQRIGDARWAFKLANRPSDLEAWKRLIGYDPGTCNFLKECIKNPQVNPLYSEDDLALDIEADCGDVPVMLRAYFAYKKKLPHIYMWSTYSPEQVPGIYPPKMVRDQSMLTRRPVTTTFRKCCRTCRADRAA